MSDLFGNPEPVKRKGKSKAKAPADPMMTEPSAEPPKLTGVRPLTGADRLDEKIEEAAADHGVNFSLSCRFLDGPAAGQKIGPFSPAPVILRVVRDADGKWDVLNEAGDKPTPQEQCFVYRINTIPLTGHVSRRPRSLSFSYSSADYVYHDEQPDRSILTQQERWNAWCDDNKRSILAKLPPDVLKFYLEHLPDDGKETRDAGD